MLVIKLGEFRDWRGTSPLGHPAGVSLWSMDPGVTALSPIDAEGPSVAVCPRLSPAFNLVHDPADFIAI